MVCVLFLVDHGTRKSFLLLFEDAVVNVVRIFLVNTYGVPGLLLLLNTVAEETETGTLTSVQVLR